jgi:membrane protein YqaA with SNARE-associated domain
MKNRTFWFLFIGVVLILILVIGLNYDYANSFIKSNVQDYGYPAIFIFSIIGNMIDQPIVPEVPAIFGILYGLNIVYVFLITSAGIWITSILNFNFGRKVLRNKIKNLCPTEKYVNYCKLFFKYGKWSLLLAALTPLPYVTFVWISGAFNMKFRTFFVFGMIAKVLRLGVILLTASMIL